MSKIYFNRSSNKNVFLLILSLFLLSCSKEKTTEVTIQDNNEDQVYNISPQSGLIGNVDLHLIPDTFKVLQL